MDFFCKIERVEPTPENIKEKEKIFYVDKYKPNKKEDFTIHNNFISNLDNFLEAGISNVCFYGKKDIGKYTLARYLISNYYNNPCLLKECILI